MGVCFLFCRFLQTRNADSILYVLRRYATCRKVPGSRPGEVNEFFSIYLILPAALGSGVYSGSKRNEYPKKKNYNFSGE
jgi:hypothetical protein